MKKFNAFIFVFCYLLMTKVVFGATITLDGKSIECDRRDLRIWECKERGRKSIMVQTENGFGVVSESSPGIVTIRPVSKIIEHYQVLYEVAEKYPPFEDSQFNRAEAAYAAQEILFSSEIPAAKELLKVAEKYISQISEVGSEVKIKLGDGDKDYKCKRGNTRALTASEVKMQKDYKTRFECNYFSCKGKDSGENVLAMIPRAGSTFSPPTVMVMKNGQAKLHEGNFKIYDNSPLLIASVNKTQLYADDEASPIPSDLFIPKKFDDSKSSFLYLNELAKNNFQDTDGLMDLCGGKEMERLFAEQKKVGEAIVDQLSETDLIEFLKLIDGKIQSHYIDRSKGLTLGCMYQGKIIDSSVMNQFPRLQEISNVKPNNKFLTPEEVQSLYKKAAGMKDIPFGYKYDGCYARAHLMAKRFEEMGIPTKKVWIRGKLFVPGTDIEWDYHVAPIVEVKEKNGKIQQYVIDPSLNSKAVTVDEWVASMGRKTKGPIMKTTYPMPANPVDFQRTTVGISSSSLFAPGDLPNLTEEAKMEHVTAKLEQYSAVLASQGK